MPVLGALPSLLAAAPTAYWLDSAEFAAAAATLGIAHPPGHPVVSLLGKAASLIPIGSVAFRVNVLSAALVGVAALALYLLARRLWRDGEPCAGGDGVDLTAAWERELGPAAIALLVVWSPGALLQGARAEVYALHLACVSVAAAVLHLRSGTDGPRAAGTAGIFIGLALANHHLLALAALPGLVALGWPAVWQKGRPAAGAGRALSLAVFGGAVGLAAYVYLPVRAAAEPAIQWGMPDTVGGFWDVVSARAFHKSASLGVAEGGSMVERLGAISFHVVTELLWLPAIAGLVGLGLALRRAPGRVTALGLLLVAAGTLAAQAVVGFDPANPDAAGYLLPAVAALALGLAVLGPRLARLMPDRLRPAVVAVLTLAAMGQLLPSARVSLAPVWDVRTLARSAAAEVPSGGAWVASTFRWVFPLQYFIVVEGWRPDAPFIQRKMFFAGQAELYARIDPRLGSLVAVVNAARSATGNNGIPPDALAAWVAERPVLVEPDPWMAPGTLGPGDAHGFMVRLGGSDDGAGDAAAALAQLARWEWLYGHLARDADGLPADPETLRTLLWAHYALTLWALGPPIYPRTAVVEYENALLLAPADSFLLTLEPRLRAATTAAAPPR